MRRRIVPLGSNPVFLTYGDPSARERCNHEIIPRASVRPRSRKLLHPSWLPKCSDEGFFGSHVES